MRNQPTSKVPKSNRIKQQSEHKNSIGPGFWSQHSLRKSYTFIERSETHLSSCDACDAETSARKKGGWGEKDCFFVCIYTFIYNVCVLSVGFDETKAVFVRWLLVTVGNFGIVE
jgi:hypothetical protein